MIPPHGGTLINGYVEGSEPSRYRRRPRAFRWSPSTQTAFGCTYDSPGGVQPPGGLHGARGVYIRCERHAPLQRAALDNTRNSGRGYALSSDLKEGARVALANAAGETVGVLLLQGKYRRDREEEAQKVYRTTEDRHPGVANLYHDGDVLLAGKITMLQGAPSMDEDIASHHRTPSQTREHIEKQGWSSVVGFQTRNPVHRAHEYIHKCALEIVNGLLLHPLVGETREGDIPASVRMRCYEALLEGYYPKNRVLLSWLPAFMRYAGPREAIFHALVRKNYGCTHFIVGRDHAGVGNYYGTYDAQRIFSEFDPEALAIRPMFFENSFFCRRCHSMATERTCPHGPDERVSLTGAQFREMLSRGEMPPEEFSRPEVAKILIEATTVTQTH